MGWGKPLNDFEKGHITALKASGQSSRAIAKALNRSHSVIDNFIKLGNKYGEKSSSGRPSKLTARQKRAVVREISTTSVSLGELARRPDIPVSKSTLSRVVKATNFLVYKKKKSVPPLKLCHKEKRVNWGKEKMGWKEEWKKVVWSDEKKFNLDGPDGWRFYWHDLRKEEDLFSKRACGGDSVMVWAAFGWNGRTNIAFINGRMNATDYQELLDTHLMPFGEQIGGSFWEFQQDNAPIHNAKSTYEWFLSNGVQVMDWPPNSPDLNPIENVWGLLARAVYAGGKIYSNSNELKTAIVSKWEEMECNVLQRLVQSMPNPVYKVLLKGGSFIGY